MSGPQPIGDALGAFARSLAQRAKQEAPAGQPRAPVSVPSPKPKPTELHHYKSVPCQWCGEADAVELLRDEDGTVFARTSRCWTCSEKSCRADVFGFSATGTDALVAMANGVRKDEEFTPQAGLAKALTEACVGKPTGLWVWGAPGTGKTMYAARTALWLASGNRAKGRRPTWCIYVEERQLFALWSVAQDFRRKEDRAAAQTALSRMMRCDVLIVDDMGAQKPNAAQAAVLLDVFDARAAQPDGSKPVIGVSNMPLVHPLERDGVFIPALSSCRDERVVSRLCALTSNRDVACLWGSYRGEM